MEKISSLIIVTSIISILIFISIKLYLKNQQLKKQIQKFTEIFNIYNEYIEKNNIYRHNIKNKIIALKNFSNNNGLKLINEILKEDNNILINNSDLYKLPNGIKGLITEKLYDKNYEIVIDNKIKGDPFKNFSSKNFNNVIDCLGISLDNAIESCQNMAKPFIIIDLYENKDCLFIKIGNNFNNSIDLDKLGDKFYTTKNKGHGLGLYFIKQSEYIKEKIEIINNVYYITLEMQKNV